MDQLLFDDTSDYLWYEFNIDSQKVDEISMSIPFEGTHAFISVYSKGQKVKSCICFESQYFGSCFPEDLGEDPENPQKSCIIDTDGKIVRLLVIFLGRFQYTVCKIN